jgi:hypothetical protein
MKILKFIPFYTLLILILSCSKSNDPGDPRDAWVGTWSGQAGTFLAMPPCNGGSGSAIGCTANLSVSIAKSPSNSSQINMKIEITNGFGCTFNVGGTVTTGDFSSGVFQNSASIGPAGYGFTFPTPASISNGKLLLNFSEEMHFGCYPTDLIAYNVYTSSLSRQ